MNKDMLNELSGLDPETVEKLAENAPELDKSTQERILKRCMAKDMSECELTVSGTERYRRPKFRNFAAAAAAVVLIGGISGAFALGSHMKKNAPVESKTGLQTMTEGSSAAGSDKVTQPASEGETAANTEAANSGKTDDEVLEPDCNEIVIVKGDDDGEQTSGSKYPELDGLPEELRKKYEEAIDDLEPGQEIHLPCLPTTGEIVDGDKVKIDIPATTSPSEPTTHYLDDPDNWGNTDNGKPISPPPQNTTAPAEYTTEPVNEPSSQTTTEPPVSPPVTNDLTFTGKYWTGSLEGYWTSDWCGQSYFHFDTNTHIAAYYNANTCTGYNFEFNYYINNDSHIEVMVLDREVGYSGELHGTGMVYWTDSDHFYIEWKSETPIRQGQQIEHFSRNYSGSMPE